MEDILQQIEAFCADHGIAETRFGEMVMNDKPFVKQLREGRDIRRSTAEKVKAFIASYGADERAA